MRIKINDTSLTVKELLTVLERVFADNGIARIQNPSLYFGSSKRIIETTLKKSEVDHESREQEGFELIAF